MRLTSFQHAGTNRYGIVTEKGVIDLYEWYGTTYKDLRSFIAGEGWKLAEVHQYVESGKVDYDISEIKYLPVIPNPDKIICIGVNYDEHRKETNLEKTDYPTIFFRVSQSQIGHGDPILLPRESEKLDYEGEIAIIIGRKGRRIPLEQTDEYIAGYACYNDASIRDWQNHTKQWSPGKNFDGTGAFGPWMVTRDEISSDQPLKLETRLNGQIMQQATTDMLVFSIPHLISYVSTFTTLQPGDVIVTGTPGGVGVKRNPPVFMKPGDVVEVTVSQVGTLRNRVVHES